MADVRLTLSDEFLTQIQQKIGRDIKPTDIAREAVALFNWAVDQRAKGKYLLSVDQKGEDKVQLSMPVLEEIKPRL
ncbi:MAG TPA: hypothetical protein VM915_17080 [Verrucomicrobiae bacterium]|jgi:hypothetical protein|nr:hypothetical protein [Verrucomicrobiae bacterium]